MRGVGVLQRAGSPARLVLPQPVDLSRRVTPGMARTIRVTASVPYPYSVTPTDGLDYGDVTAGTFPVTDSVTIKNTSGTGLDLSLSLVGSDLSSFDNVDFVGSTCRHPHLDGLHPQRDFGGRCVLQVDHRAEQRGVRRSQLLLRRERTEIDRRLDDLRPPRLDSRHLPQRSPLVSRSAPIP